MRLPARLSHRNPQSYKTNFGHVLVVAGSKRLLGAAALTALSVMRAGAGLVTLGIPQSLNSVAQKKISNVVMTWPLPETKEATIDVRAFEKIRKKFSQYSVIALGPGLSQNPSTQKLILKIVEKSTVPLVIDADALNALAGHVKT